MSTTRPACPKAPATNAALAAAGLVLCAHGGAAGSGAAADLAGSIRRMGVFAGVEGCSLNGTPDLAKAFERITADEIFVAPLLMAEGYTCTTVLPRAIEAAHATSRRIVQCRPLGVSGRLPEIIVGLAEDVCAARGWNPRRTAIVVAGHGTERSPASADSANELAAAVMRTGSFAAARVGFLEQVPYLTDALKDVRSAPCVVVGFFVDEGTHAAGDVPAIIAAAHPDVAYTGPIGKRAEMADLILDLVRAAVPESV